MKLSPSKTVAIIAWLTGCWATYNFLSVMIVSEALVCLGSALLLQAVFTASETTIWKGQGNWFHWGLLVIDILTNIGGIYEAMKKLDRTDAWKALSDGILGTVTTITPGTALAVSAALGLLIAASPEFIWKQGQTNDPKH